MTTALEHRLAELDREIATSRVGYELAQAMVRADGYGDKMLTVLGRIAELASLPDNAANIEAHALVAIGRILELVEPFKELRARIDRYDTLKVQRQKLERVSG